MFSLPDSCARLSPSALLACALLVAGFACERSRGSSQDSAVQPATAQASASPRAEGSGGESSERPQVPPGDVPFVAAKFHRPAGVSIRGALSGLSGRYGETPGIVASPCGFYLVDAGGEISGQALLLGRDIGWTDEAADQLIRVEGVTFEVGLATAQGMGNAAARGDELLTLYGQWELAWLKKETSEAVLVKENARGEAHAAPHPAWRVWSTTLRTPLAMGERPTHHLIVATAALGDRVLVIRALLPDESRALWTLKRLVFAVDSLELRTTPIARNDFVAGLEARMAKDQTCEELHLTYGKQLE